MGWDKEENCEQDRIPAAKEVGGRCAEKTKDKCSGEEVKER